MDESSRIEALQAFFTVEAAGRSPSVRRRYEWVHQHLLHYLDVADVSRSLGTCPAAVLDGERQFSPDGAFFRLFAFEELICCVPDFLSDEWLMPARADARTQISLAGRLLTWLDRHQLFDWQVTACVYWEADTAIRRARTRLRGDALPYESYGT